MKPISELSPRSLKAVFTDLDGTLTEETVGISATCYNALWELREAGFKIVIVSGRPAGWADCLMRLWPLDAMIFENGAGLCVREAFHIKRIPLAPETHLAKNQERLSKIFQSIKEEIPHLKHATDQPFRQFDSTVDFNEEPPKLSESELSQVIDRLNSHQDITWKLSNIHINFWVGKYTKITACEYLLNQYSPSWNIEKSQVVFSGDSPNDEPLFKFFGNSVGVANIRDFLPKMKHPPRYVTSLPGGEGFCELASHLLTE